MVSRDLAARGRTSFSRLFFEHFTDTSFAAERDGRLAGFLAGFIAQSRPGEASIHFAGVDPARRGNGLGRLLYEAFFQAAGARGAAGGCPPRSATSTSPTTPSRTLTSRRPGGPLPGSGSMTWSGTCGWQPPSAASGGPRTCGGCSPRPAWRSPPGRCRTCAMAGRSRSASTTLDIICAVLDETASCWCATAPRGGRAPAGASRGRGGRAGDPPVTARRAAPAAGVSSWPQVTCMVQRDDRAGPRRARLVQALLCPRPAPGPALRGLWSEPGGTWPRACAPAATGCR